MQQPIGNLSLGGFSGLIGAARCDITPPVGIGHRNWGAQTHETAEGIHRPLELHALALAESPNAEPLVLLSADLGWWRNGLDESRIRNAACKALGVDGSRFILALSHTHAGPVLSSEAGNPLNAEYLRNLEYWVIEASKQAVENLEAGTIRFGVGKCVLAANRDLPEPASSRILCGWNPNEPADDTLVVGCAVSMSGRLLATLVNYACHPTTLAWLNRQISPDFVGSMREALAANGYDAPCLFLQGASGELAPREQYGPGTAAADRHGRTLGFAALAALEPLRSGPDALQYCGCEESGAPLADWVDLPVSHPKALSADYREVTLPLKEGYPTSPEIEAELASCCNRVLRERLIRKLAIRRDLGEGKEAKVPLWCWAIGDALLAAQPNEAHSPLQMTLREQFAGRPVLVINTANGPYAGYYPPQEIYPRDQYQVWQTPFASGCMEQFQSEIARSFAGLMDRTH